MNAYSDGARELRNAYIREWRQRNPDKVKKANKQYWEKRAAKERSLNANTDKSAKGGADQ